RFDASIDPPCASTRPRAIASPSPEPVESGERTNRSKTRGRTSGAMPGPVSESATPTHCPPDRRPPAGAAADTPTVMDPRVGGIDAVDQPLEIALDHGEWRAQLVCDVGEKRAAGLFIGLETGAHLVERAGERSHLTRATFRHTDRVIAGFDCACRLDQIAD